MHLRPVLSSMALAGLLIATAVAPSASSVTTPFAETTTRQLAPGIRHATGSMVTGGSRVQAVQVATIDLSEPSVSVRSLLSNDRVIGLEPPSELAQRTSSPAARAIVATNGDVSIAGGHGAENAPQSLHVSRGEVLVGQECATPTLGIMEDGRADIDLIRVRTRIDLGYRVPDWWSTELRISGINTRRVANEAILYTPWFGPRTLTDDGGTEVILASDGPIAPWGEVGATIVAIREQAGNTRIGEGRMVLSVSGAMRSQLAAMRVGDAVTIRTVVQEAVGGTCGREMVDRPDWAGLTEAMGGNWFVARDGRNAAPSGATYPKGAVAAPRTSVGVTADGRVLMVVVDGRQPGYSIGVTLAELGGLMLDLGAVSAFNLDGGGSTVMAIRRPGADRIRVSDRPSDGRERSLTQALAAFSSAAP